MSLALWQSIAQLTPPDSSILDVGAFHGEYSIAARKVNQLCSVYAFEPNPTSLEVLRPTCRDVGVILVENAIADENKSFYFYCDEQISKLVSDRSGANVINITAYTLDTWSQANNNVPFLLKIDVEDAAGRILQGSQTVLTKHRPIVLCEVLTDQIGSTAMNALPPDYDLYYINEDSGLEPKTVVGRYDWRYKNWLFVPAEKRHLLRAEFFFN